jgi:hypothetical protein
LGFALGSRKLSETTFSKSLSAIYASNSSAPAQPKRILDFYSISPGATQFAEVPADLTKKLAGYDVPVFQLGRLAVDLSQQGQGLGGELLLAAGARALAVAAHRSGRLSVIHPNRTTSMPRSSAALTEGYGYDITGVDVLDAYAHTMRAAENAGVTDKTRRRIQALVSQETFGERFVTRCWGNTSGFSRSVPDGPDPAGRVICKNTLGEGA